MTRIPPTPTTPRFAARRNPLLALGAAALLATVPACAQRQSTIRPNQDGFVRNEAPASNWKVTRALTKLGFDRDKIDAVLSLPYTRYPEFFPEPFSVAERPFAVSVDQSVIGELKRKEITAQDIRDIGQLLRDPDAFLPELKLKYKPDTQARQLLHTIQQRAMNASHRPSPYSLNPQADRYVDIIKKNTYVSQMRDESEMHAEYRRLGLADDKITHLAGIGNVMGGRDRLPQIPGVVFEGPVNFPKGLNRHWQHFGPDLVPELNKLSESHWASLRQTVENVRSQGTDKDMQNDRRFMDALKAEAKAGTLAAWNRRDPEELSRYLADKAGYQVTVTSPDNIPPINVPLPPPDNTGGKRVRFADFPVSPPR